MDADCSFELISIETYASKFIGHNIFFLGRVCPNIYTVSNGAFVYYLTYVHILNTDAESLDTRRSKTKAFACKK